MLSATISGVKYNTASPNNFGPGDVPKSGVTIQLYQDNGDGVFSPADVLVDQQVTAPVTGAYTFSNVADGKFFIKEIVPTGFVQSAGPAFYTVQVLGGSVYVPTTEINVDNFSDPDPNRTFFISAIDPNPLLLQDSGTGILGDQRDLLINVLGVPNPISANGFVGTVAVNNGVFNLGTASSGPGTSATFQYDGVDADTTALNNAQALSVDLVDGGNNGFRFDFNFLQVGAGTTTDLAITATSPGGGTATFNGNITENGGVFSVFVPFSSFATAGTFTFSNVSSLKFTLNGTGVQDVDLELDQILAVQQRNTGFNFGNFPLISSIGGFVYVDGNNNGIKEPGELPIGCVIITLTGTNDLGQPVVQQTSTDALGAYIFTGLRPGVYQIVEAQPINFVDGKDTIGTPGGNTSNDMFSNINLPPNFNGVNNNFGELGLTPTYSSKRTLIVPLPQPQLCAVYPPGTVVPPPNTGGPVMAVPTATHVTATSSSSSPVAAPVATPAAAPVATPVASAIPTASTTKTTTTTAAAKPAVVAAPAPVAKPAVVAAPQPAATPRPTIVLSGSAPKAAAPQAQPTVVASKAPVKSTPAPVPSLQLLTASSQSAKKKR